jgi:glycosyltransferase involved in cell wall biosynthesis
VRPPPQASTPDIGPVAVLIESDGPGGAESTVLSLVNGIAARGVEVRPAVFSGGEGWLTARLQAAGHRVYLPTLSRPVDPVLAYRMSQWARRERLGVLHAHEFTMGFYAGMAGALSGVPHVLTMHGGTSFAIEARRRIALRLSARRAAAVVGVSDSTCEHLASSLTLPRSRVEHIPNGVIHRAGDRAATRAAMSLGESDQLLLAVGNLYSVKGHAVLVEAAASLARQVGLPPWRIAIAGRGDEERALREQIAAAGLDGRVQLLGLRNDIHDLLAAADGWVMPSLSEGLPLALLEAMLAALPVVASAVGGIPALIRADCTGALVPAGDSNALAVALDAMLRNPQQAKQMAQQGRLLVHEKYSFDAMLDRYMAIYRRALLSDGRRRAYSPYPGAG